MLFSSFSDKGWLGWKRKGSKPIELIFEFANLRSFSKVSIFTSNRFDLNIQVFKRALVGFSLDGRDYRGQDHQPETYEYMPDLAIQESRNISIPIKNKIGRFVKIQLVFENIWILISEVTFSSEVIEDEEAAEKALKKRIKELEESSLVVAAAPPIPMSVPAANNNYNKATTKLSVGTSAIPPLLPGQQSEPSDGAKAGGIEQVERAENNSVYLEIIIGVLTAVTLLLLFLFIAVLMYSRRQKFLNSPTSRSLNPFPVQLNMKVIHKFIKLSSVRNECLPKLCLNHP